MPNAVPNFQRTGGAERLMGRALVVLLRLGLVRGHFYVLEVRGRKSGRIVSLPVDPIDVDGKRYLVCARGESNWVRNVRAAGEMVLTRARRRHCYAVREVPPNLRPPILKAYLDLYAHEVQRFFPVLKGSPADAFNDLAARYPVLELQVLHRSAAPSGSGSQ